MEPRGLLEPSPTHPPKSPPRPFLPPPKERPALWRIEPRGLLAGSRGPVADPA